jgi:hypothetical protein
MVKRQLDEPLARNWAQAADFISDDLLELGGVGGHAFQVTHRGAGYQPWEGSLPRPAAAGRFPEPGVFVGRAIGIRLEAWHVFAAREDATGHPYLNITSSGQGYVGQAAHRPGRGAAAPARYAGIPALPLIFRLNGCDAGESCEAPDAYA